MLNLNYKINKENRFYNFSTARGDSNQISNKTLKEILKKKWTYYMIISHDRDFRLFFENEFLFTYLYLEQFSRIENKSLKFIKEAILDDRFQEELFKLNLYDTDEQKNNKNKKYKLYLKIRKNVLFKEEFDLKRIELGLKFKKEI